MEEVKAIAAATSPAETLLVVDAMTGQDAVNTAQAFNIAVGITGVVLTRMDGDARGGAALSMRAITGAPIKLIGVGEKQDALEDFHPERVAGRILGMGDIVGLVERASETIDQALMDEVKAISAATSPAETLLVVDAMTGQDAVNTAQAFNIAVGITGVVLTRMDGDARGGAALSMRAVTGAPIKFSGSGEKIDALEEFHPERVAGRILGLGDIAGLVERAAETIDQGEAEKIAKKMLKGSFTLEDYASQLKQISKMGSISSILGMMPGMGQLKEKLEGANIDQSIFKRQQAIISSMTVKERRAPDIIKASRKKRIAAGSGTSVAEVNKLLKQFDDMSEMMKRMGKLGQKGLMRGGLAALMPKGMGQGRRPF